jgi:hypothetical protein
MMARESSLWKWLSNSRNVLRDRVDLRRVEDAIGAGFPDVDGFLRGEPDPAVRFYTKAEREEYERESRWVFPFKLELKSEIRPARHATPIRFALEKRRAQIEFMRRRYTMGEAAYFLLQVGESADCMRYLAPGDAGARLREGMTESELAVLCATENGMVFDHKQKPATIIERIRTCYNRRCL